MWDENAVSPYENLRARHLKPSLDTMINSLGTLNLGIPHTRMTNLILLGGFAGSRLRRLSMSIAVAAGLLLVADARAQSETEFYDNGMGLLGQKRLAAAEAEFRKAVSADPRYREAWQALADVLRMEGQGEQANAVQRIAASAPASRSGAAPALSADQQRALTATPALAAVAPPSLVAPRDKAPELNAAKPAAITALPHLAPKTGYLIGRAVSEDGRPIPQFTVAYSGFENDKLAASSGGELEETISDTLKARDGRYEIKLPPGAYRVSSYVTYQFRNRTYHFELEPFNAPAQHDFHGLELDKLGGGLVRDFVLRMTARRADADEGTESVYRAAYFGGRVDFDADQTTGIVGGGNRFTTALRDAFPAESRVEVTFAPEGPLVDATSGSTVTADLRLGDDGKYTFSRRGVFPGTYSVTARLTTSEGKSVPLHLSLSRARTVLKGAGDYDLTVMDWQTSVVVDFLPTDLGPEPHFGVKAVTLYLGP